MAYQRIAIKNHGDRNVDFELSFGFASDFADIFEVRGERRGRRGIAHRPHFGTDKVLLKYQGLDGEIRRTKIVFNPMPNELEHNSARYRLSLCSNQSISIFVVLSCDPPHEKPTAFFKAMTAARRETRAAGRDYHRRAAELEAQVAKL